MPLEFALVLRYVKAAGRARESGGGAGGAEVAREDGGAYPSDTAALLDLNAMHAVPTPTSPEHAHPTQLPSLSAVFCGARRAVCCLPLGACAGLAEPVPPRAVVTGLGAERVHVAARAVSTPPSNTVR